MPGPKKKTETKKATSLTFSTELLSLAKARAKTIGYSSFSEYCEALVSIDLDTSPIHIREHGPHGITHSKRDNNAPNKNVTYLPNTATRTVADEPLNSDKSPPAKEIQDSAHRVLEKLDENTENTEQT